MTETVVVTASAGAFPGLAEALSAIPVRITEHPLLRFTAPPDWSAVDGALDRLGSYGAVAFTSPRAAEAVAERWRHRGRSWNPDTPTPVIWASGSATELALHRSLGLVRTPRGSEAARLGAAAALAEAMLTGGVASPVLFPCGDIHRDELPEHLRSKGVRVDEIVCYTSVLATDSEARTAAAEGTVLVVASPRVALLLAGACPPGARPDLVAVGPTTARTAEEAGWVPAAVASLSTVEAVMTAVRGVIARRCAHE